MQIWNDLECLGEILPGEMTETSWEYVGSSHVWAQFPCLEWLRINIWINDEYIRLSWELWTTWLRSVYPLVSTFTKNYGKNITICYWNHLFPWPLSIAMQQITESMGEISLVFLAADLHTLKKGSKIGQGRFFRASVAMWHAFQFVCLFGLSSGNVLHS